MNKLQAMLRWTRLIDSKNDVFFVLIIFLAGLKLTFGLENFLDIRLHDESNYLHNGVLFKDIVFFDVDLVSILDSEEKHPAHGFTRLGLPRAEFAPLYAIWYCVISLFVANKISLYYFNYKMMTVLPSVCVYIMLRSKRVNIYISVVVAWLLLVSHMNIYTWPKVSHFALIVILLLITLLGYIQSSWLFGLVASIGVLLVSYIRPEYFLSYMVITIYIFVLSFVNYKKNGNFSATVFCAYILFSVSIISIFGFPVNGNRSVGAFAQHFSLNWVLWTGSNLNPWSDWQQILEKNFGSVSSIWDAFVNNPLIFLEHIAFNVSSFPSKLYSLVFPIGFFSDNLSNGIITLSVVVLGIMFSANARVGFQTCKKTLILIVVMLVPGFVSIAVIYPRDHYILLLYVLTVIFLVIVLNGYRFDRYGNFETIRQKDKLLLPFGLLIIGLTPYFVNQINISRQNLETIQFIKTLNVEESVNMLEAEGGYHIYLEDNFHWVAHYDKNSSFDEFMISKQINMIVVSPRLLEDTRFINDPVWYGFLENYSDFGWVQMYIPYTDRELFMHLSLHSEEVAFDFSSIPRVISLPTPYAHPHQCDSVLTLQNFMC